MYSKEDYLKLARKKDPKPVNMEAVRAAPQMAVLTNSEEWDKYLSYLEPLAKQAENKAQEIADQLLNPTLFEAEKLFLLKSEHIKMTERAEVIRQLMTFPKDIIEYGKLNREEEA